MTSIAAEIHHSKKRPHLLQLLQEHGRRLLLVPRRYLLEETQRLHK